MKPIDKPRPLLLIMGLSLGIAVAAWFGFSNNPPAGPTGDTVELWLQQAGPLGPFLVVGLMTAAVVASPIPSAPIAVVAGAVYGHVLGTALVAIGAELGALIAFAIARWLGHDALRRRFGNRLDLGLLGSQNVLMLTVFASRLMPFVSFDMMSYAAGLTRLHLWRFALATLAGILPASLALAHIGEKIAGSDAVGMGLTVFGLGLVTGAPLLWLAWKRSTGKGRPLQRGETDQNNSSRSD